MAQVRSTPRVVAYVKRLALIVVMASALAAAPARAADPPDPGSTQTFTYGSGESAYPYIVYVPTSYDPARQAPLLVMTHGCQTTAKQQMRGNLYNPLADREGFIVLYPYSKSSEASPPPSTASCWQFPSPL